MAIVLTDGLPITYSQERSGKHLKPFRVHKLRTMIKDAEKHSGAVLAEEDDPRVTRVGRFLRKTRIDELPQLFNIIKGEMSFIGPRPERPVFVEQFCEEIPRLPRALQRQTWRDRARSGQRRLRHDARAQAEVRPHLHVSSELGHGRTDRRGDPEGRSHGPRRQIRSSWMAKGSKKRQTKAAPYERWRRRHPTTR